MLQDDAAAGVWERWGAEWRDVVILGPDNQPVAVYSLSEHTLTDRDDYEALKQLLVDVAEGK